MSWRLNPRDLTGAWILTEAERDAIRGVLRDVERDVERLKHLATLTERRGRIWFEDQSKLESPHISRPSGRQLPQRLADVLECVTPGHALVDIGTDHAYLPIAALLTGVSPVAIGVDIARAPLIQARQHANSAGAEALMLLCGDGVQPLLDQPKAWGQGSRDIIVHDWSERAERDWRVAVDQGAVSVTICGVGGHTAAEKIAELPEWVSEVHVQANHALYEVEQALASWSDHTSTLSERITLTAQRLFLTLSATRPQSNLSPQRDHSTRRDPHLELWRWVKLSRSAHGVAKTPAEHLRAEQRDELMSAVDVWLCGEI